MNTRLYKQAKPTSVSSMVPAHSGVLQCKCACGGMPGPTGDCAACRRERLVTPGSSPLQTKLTINQPGDRYEREADRVAAQVMRMPELRLQRQAIPEAEEEEELLQTKPLVQRQTELEGEEEDEELLQTKPLLQRQANDGIGTPSATPAIVHDVLRAPGRPLDPNTRAFMEPRFGHDFSQVRVHTDARASQSARAVHARAFTVGRDIAFGAGEYTPETAAGRRLLAHELTHVAQQGAARGHGAAIAGRDLHPAATGMLQRAPNDPQGFINEHKGLLGIDLYETSLGNDLRQLVLESDTNIDFVLAVFDALGSDSRDEVAYYFVKPLDDAELNPLAESENGRRLLTRLRDEMTGGIEWPEETQEMARIDRALAAATAPIDTSSFPFSDLGIPGEIAEDEELFGIKPTDRSLQPDAPPFPSEEVGDDAFTSSMGQDLWLRVQVVWTWIGKNRFRAIQLIMEIPEILDQFRSVLRRVAPATNALDGLIEEINYTLDFMWELGYEDPFLGERFAAIALYLLDLEPHFAQIEAVEQGDEQPERLQQLVDGLLNGLSSLGSDQMTQFGKRLDDVFIYKHPLLSRLYFQGGMIWGVVEPASNVVKVIFDLMTPERAAPHEQALQEAIAAFKELVKELLGPNAGQVAYDIGYALGAQIPNQIVALNKIDADLDFASELGKKIGPIFVEVVLSLLGFEAVVTARVIEIGENVLDAFVSVKKLKSLLPVRALRHVDLPDEWARVLSSDEVDFLDSTKGFYGNDIPDDEALKELDIAKKGVSKTISDGEYVEQIDLPNNHSWKRKEMEPGVGSQIRRRSASTQTDQSKSEKIPVSLTLNHLL